MEKYDSVNHLIGRIAGATSIRRDGKRCDFSLLHQLAQLLKRVVDDVKTNNVAAFIWVVL